MNFVSDFKHPKEIKPEYFLKGKQGQSCFAAFYWTCENLPRISGEVVFENNYFILLKI